MSLGDDPLAAASVALPMPELVQSIGDARSSGRLSEADALCRVAIAREPENASLRIWLGWIALDRKLYAEAVAAAREAASLREHDAPGVARLLVYAGAMSGDWRSADQALVDLGRRDEAAARDIATEAAPAFLAFLDALKQRAAFQDAVDSFEHTPAMLYAAAPGVMREIGATASLCYLALGKAEAAIAIFGDAATPMPRDASSVPSPAACPRPVLVTSLMPARLDVQKAAVASWRRLGFDIASLNARDEIASLNGEFDDVTFHAAERDARERFGRPLVYLEDMLTLLAREPNRIGGIVNSDIVFTGAAGPVVTRAVASAREAFVFGHRVEVDRLSDTPEASSAVYLFGYDWFLFQTEHAAELAGGNLVFGAPWWDLWLPLKARSLAMDLVNARDPVALHEHHEARWSQVDLQRMARVFAAAIVAEADRARRFSPFSRRLRDLAAVLRRMAPEAFIGETLVWLASLARGLAQREAEPLGAELPDLKAPFWDAMGRI